MEDNKDLMNEQTVVEAAEVTPVNDVPEIKAESAMAKPGNNGKWGSSAVTKKFMTAALAATILINAGVTAGVMSLTAKNNGHDRPDMQKGSRPGTEMFSENGPGSKGQMTQPQNGQMAPPQNGQNNNSQMTPPQDGQNNNGPATPPADNSNNAQDQLSDGAEQDS